MTSIHGRFRASVQSAAIAAAACLLFAPAPADAVITSQVNASGQLILGGDGGSDDYLISCVGGGVKVNGADPGSGPAACASITTLFGDTATGDDVVDLTAVSSAVGFTHPGLSGSSGTTIALGEGADIGLLGPLGGVFEAEGGNDDLRGSDLRDRLFGGRGADVIRGGGGSDLINAGHNNDQVFGGAGSDRLLGQVGADLILGSGGRDLLLGGNGVDALLGGAGRDSARGDRGRDRCRAEVQRGCEF